MKNKSSRRNFIKTSALGLGVFPPLDKGPSSPDQLQSNSKLNIVCVGAHPGDPEFGCGGTLIKYSDAGHTVTIIYLNRGEAGDPGKTFSESAALRTKEAEISCKVMNAKPRFAGQIDGNSILSNEKNQEMTTLILSLKPDVVFTHWPLDTHGDHQVASLLTLNAWLRSGKRFHLYFYEVNTGDETIVFTPTDYVDITNVRDRKKSAMFAHKTQDPAKVYDTYFKAMEDFRGLQAGVKAAEGFIRMKTKSEQANIIGL